MSVSRLLSRIRWQRLAVLPVLGALVGVLAGCDQPTPLVTMQAGRSFVQAQAASYDRDGTVVKGAGDQIPALHAAPGEIINIDVPKSVADRGYFLTSVDAQSNEVQISDTIKDQHYHLTTPGRAGELPLTIFQVPRSDSGPASGSWKFRLVVQP
ncbi:MULTISPECIES: hypothetical protein [unclassified Frankia]|uniref:hypothetical protein n=1 Tax=unclassified Frankia TaxID=2632575 RepID=UPI002AD32859|nr:MULTISPECIES: hypothetical protein [unclassified Frankia]